MHAMNQQRLVNLFGFLACAGLMGYALYSQHVLGLEPCPLCIFQRVGIISLGVVFLAATLHNPRGWFRYVYTVLIAIAALATVGVASRHLYVQAQPPGSVPSCGAPLDILWQYSPALDVVKTVLQGGGEGRDVDGLFIGVGLAAWVLVCGVL